MLAAKPRSEMRDFDVEYDHAEAGDNGGADPFAWVLRKPPTGMDRRPHEQEPDREHQDRTREPDDDSKRMHSTPFALPRDQVQQAKDDNGNRQQLAQGARVVR